MASIARIGPSEDGFYRVCRPIAPLWVKKTMKNGPLRSIRSRRSISPTGLGKAIGLPAPGGGFIDTTLLHALKCIEHHASFLRRHHPQGFGLATASQRDDFLVKIQVPVQAPGSDGVYSRFRRTAAEHRPLVNFSLLTRRRGRVCEQALLVVGASTLTQARTMRAEEFLAGKTVTADIAGQAAEMVAADIEPLSDPRGTAESRRDMVRVVARRAISGLFGLATE